MIFSLPFIFCSFPISYLSVNLFLFLLLRAQLLEVRFESVSDLSGLFESVLSFSHVLGFLFYIFMLNVLILEFQFLLFCEILGIDICQISQHSLMVNCFIIYFKILDCELNFSGALSGRILHSLY